MPFLLWWKVVSPEPSMETNPSFVGLCQSWMRQVTDMRTEGFSVSVSHRDRAGHFRTLSLVSIRVSSPSFAKYSMAFPRQPGHFPKWQSTATARRHGDQVDGGNDTHDAEQTVVNRQNLGLCLIEQIRFSSRASLQLSTNCTPGWRVHSAQKSLGRISLFNRWLNPENKTQGHWDADHTNRHWRACVTCGSQKELFYGNAGWHGLCRANDEMPAPAAVQPRSNTPSETRRGDTKVVPDSSLFS